ncbi:MAG: type I DNA topoisomerase [Elusimicrobiales bacterium]|nr:type I DNA topoisomerase [Elusimicrobiales bacterium]
MATKKTTTKKATGSEKYLVIVESPTKEKTISRFLDGSFRVKSSFGHIRDLPADCLGVDETSFEPTYKLLPRGTKIAAELNRLAKGCDTIYLATDPDREGEAIAWHLTHIIKVPADKFKRIAFHEITKQAIAHSLETPRGIDLNLVNAQQARRIIDRLVGYKLSPLLWSKIKSGLSAGRVQSVSVRLIAERAKEIAAFKEEDYFTLFTKLTKDKANEFEAKVVKWDGQTIEKTVLMKLFSEDYRHKTSIFKKFEDTVPVATFLKENELTVQKVEKKSAKQKPRPPFITSTIQQDAYNRLGFSSDRTMRIAQSLYEGIDFNGEREGLITYMRTDSFNVSQEMLKETAKFIKESYGADFVPEKFRVYATKVKGAQEAHESIHPTSVYRKPSDLKESLSVEQYKLYDLIWRRYVSCQMEDAQFDVVSMEVGDEKKKALLRASGRTMKFEGYLKVYKDLKKESDDDKDEKEGLLPVLKEGDILELKDIETKSHKTSHPPYYNEASIIRTLEKHGIGRPSTYAAIIKTVMDRGYIKRNPKEKKILITELGDLVTDKLKGFFSDIMSLSYTAGIEGKLDNIAEGKDEWIKVMKDFYSPFTKNLKIASKDMTVTKPSVQKTKEKCPECGSFMDLRESRFGKYLACSRFPKCRGKIGLDAEGNKKVVVKPIKTDKTCTKCKKNKMLLRKSARGFFLACSGFPRCRNINPITEEEIIKLHKDAGVEYVPVVTEAPKAADTEKKADGSEKTESVKSAEKKSDSSENTESVKSAEKKTKE